VKQKLTILISKSDSRKVEGVRSFDNHAGSTIHDSNLPNGCSDDSGGLTRAAATAGAAKTHSRYIYIIIILEKLER
jgi:hypothetical protein